MSDKVIPLADENAARAAEAAKPPAGTAERVREIFARRDPLKTLAMQPQIVETLSTIFDPEIPVNIYDLGLIYETAVDPETAIGVRMTLTAPACPAAQTLPVEVATKLKQLPGVSDVFVDIVWDPPWDRDRMSDVAKLQLGMF